jgi:antitoxin ChpS
MTIGTLRRVGGSVMLAIPPALLDVTQLKADMEVGLTVTNGSILIEPRRRRRYSLADLIAKGKKSARATQREWVDAPAVGKELL